ncbi:hypothetical protein [Rhizobium halophytocola]|uniref:DUF465 domain-containing protein n=1 Tax=Rhizobium halophytocola TaxID=735519 RepID=A0ABS4E426_9HYPH|nr:hypothetical protein [Rhizobium halophytocola]MBP1852705.1 hypothetical protein [Rhizobium halophytocola]
MGRHLPLFRQAELKRLQERREALLKRLQHLRPMSHRRVGVQAKLCDITTELLRLEREERPR